MPKKFGACRVLFTNQLFKILLDSHSSNGIVGHDDQNSPTRRLEEREHRAAY